MRTPLLLLTAAALIAAGFCAGAATKPALKFPWAGDELNKPCGKTELEWRLATKSIRQDKPIPVGKWFMLNSLTATPKDGGLVAIAELTTRQGSRLRRGDPGWGKECEEACSQIFWQIQERFGEGKGYEDKLFRYWTNLALGLRVDGKPAMEFVNGTPKLVLP